jgi:hypothetical protein
VSLEAARDHAAKRCTSQLTYTRVPCAGSPAVLSFAATTRKLMTALQSGSSWIGAYSAAVLLRPCDAYPFEISDAEWLRRAQAVERTYETFTVPGLAEPLTIRSPSGLVPPASVDEEATHDLLVAIIAIVSEMLGMQQAAADAEEKQAQASRARARGGASTSSAGGASGTQSRVLAALAWSLIPAATEAVELLHARWVNGPASDQALPVLRCFISLLGGGGAGSNTGGDVSSSAAASSGGGKRGKKGGGGGGGGGSSSSSAYRPPLRGEARAVLVRALLCRPLLLKVYMLLLDPEIEVGHARIHASTCACAWIVGTKRPTALSAALSGHPPHPAPGACVCAPCRTPTKA